MQKATLNNRIASRLPSHRVAWACFFVLAIFFAASVFVSRARAQGITPTVIVSWKSQSFVPYGYSGKAMPVYNSRVELAADVLLGTNFVDPDLLFYTWSLNGPRLASGKGRRKTSFVVKSGPRTNNWVRVEVDLLGKTIKKDFFVPTDAPRIVITQQRPYNILKEGVNLFTARPFFFSAQSMSSLSFNWLFNGSQVKSESAPFDKFALEILPQTPSGTSASIEVEVKNGANVLESASQNLSLVVE